MHVRVRIRCHGRQNDHTMRARTALALGALPVPCLLLLGGPASAGAHAQVRPATSSAPLAVGQTVVRFTVPGCTTVRRDDSGRVVALMTNTGQPPAVADPVYDERDPHTPLAARVLVDVLPRVPEATWRTGEWVELVGG